jgi:hypothetical protein
LAAALALALATVFVGSPADVAQAQAPSEDVVTYVDGDTVSEVASPPSDLSLASVWTFEAPYSIDPHIAWREITSIPVGPQVWEIWRCDLPGEPTTLSPAAVVAGLEGHFDGVVTDWFEKMSGGRYSPSFVAEGAYPAPDLRGCIASAYLPYGATGASDDHGLIGLTESGSPSGLGSPGLLEYSYSPTSLRLRPGTRHLAIGGVDGTGPGGTVPDPNIDMLIHEMGHSLGWSHVPLRGATSPYSNRGDIMSGGGTTTAAINLYSAGWIDPSDVPVWNGGTSSFRLGGHLSSRTQMLVIPTEEQGVFHTVSAPAADYASVASSGVAVHYVDQSAPGQGYCIEDIACTLISRVVEALRPPGHATSEAPVMGPGESMVVGSWQVTVSASHSDGFTVELSGNAPGPLEPVASTGGPFTDVPLDHVFVSAIRRLADAGITKGCNPPENTRFCPSDFVTRGQFAAFLVRAMSLPEYTGPDRFSDDDDSVFEGAIERLAQAGVTVGCNPPDNTRFCPDSRVTRGQMAAFLVRALASPEYTGADRFGDDNDSVFQDAIERLAQAGVTVGCNPPTNSSFCPDSHVTRGQMATFLVRAGLVD